MKKPRCVFIEVAPACLRVVDGDQGVELPLAREDNGRLSSGAQAAVVDRLQSFLKPRGAKTLALCAVSARGVSVRRLNLPPTSEEALPGVLALQLESEFPLPPDQLAWGYCDVANLGVSSNGAGDRPRDLLVAAVKRETLDEHSDVLTRAGLIPVFTLAACARTALIQPPPSSYAVLEIGREQSELTLVENGAMVSTRILGWGVDLLETPGSSPHGAAESLATLVLPSLGARTLYLTGEGARVPALRSALLKAQGADGRVDALEVPAAPGHSAATAGLGRLWAAHAADLPLPTSAWPSLPRALRSTLGRTPERVPGLLTLQVNQPEKAADAPRQAAWQWAAAAGALLLLSLSLRYAAPLLGMRSLEHRVQQLRSQFHTLPAIDRDLAFLQFLETNQPPYLDVLYQLATAAPTGARLESATMSRRGDVALRGAAPASQHALDLRSNLVECGLFSTVVLDEQSPTPDRQKVSFRLTAQLRPPSDRPKPVVLAPSGTASNASPSSPTAPPSHSSTQGRP